MTANGPRMAKTPADGERAERPVERPADGERAERPGEKPAEILLSKKKRRRNAGVLGSDFRSGGGYAVLYDL